MDQDQVSDGDVVAGIAVARWFAEQVVGDPLLRRRVQAWAAAEYPNVVERARNAGHSDDDIVLFMVEALQRIVLDVARSSQVRAEAIAEARRLVEGEEQGPVE